MFWGAIHFYSFQGDVQWMWSSQRLDRGWIPSMSEKTLHQPRLGRPMRLMPSRCGWRYPTLAMPKTVDLIDLTKKLFLVAAAFLGFKILYFHLMYIANRCIFQKRSWKSWDVHNVLCLPCNLGPLQVAELAGGRLEQLGQDAGGVGMMNLWFMEFLNFHGP